MHENKAFPGESDNNLEQSVEQLLGTLHTRAQEAVDSERVGVFMTSDNEGSLWFILTPDAVSPVDTEDAYPPRAMGWEKSRTTDAQGNIEETDTNWRILSDGTFKATDTMASPDITDQIHNGMTPDEIEAVGEQIVQRHQEMAALTETPDGSTLLGMEAAMRNRSTADYANHLSAAIGGGEIQNDKMFRPNTLN